LDPDPVETGAGPDATGLDTAHRVLSARGAAGYGPGKAGDMRLRSAYSNLCAALVAGVVTVAAPAAARAWGGQTGGSLFYVEPRESFGRVVERGFGFQGFGVLNLDPAGVLGLRVDLGVINYGNESFTVPLSNTVRRVGVTVTTSNNIAMASIGPQITVPAGPLRPYGFATIGLGYFFTESSVAGSSGEESFASSLNFDDVTAAVTAGGGVQAPLTRHVLLDLGAEYRRHREVRYLTEGDIVEQPDGGMEFRSRQSGADVILFKVGATYSFW
jgi:opacity protein-like surface antigen